jgi:type I restriction enzyme S subunit
LPPLPEQEHIVAKIEELFTQLDAGTAALKRVQTGLKCYKASVLKAACEGRLFDVGASGVGAHGVRPSEPVNLSAQSGRTPSALTNELPDGWKWTTIGDVIDSLDNMRIPVNKKDRENRDGKYPYYGANGQVD